jgi:hypothetical protein
MWDTDEAMIKTGTRDATSPRKSHPSPSSRGRLSRRALVPWLGRRGSGAVSCQPIGLRPSGPSLRRRRGASQRANRTGRCLVLHPLRWARRAVAVLLCLAVGVLDVQAFQGVPLLHPLDVTGLGHALLLITTGLLAGVLLRSWWALGLALLAYLVGFEAASAVVFRSVAGPTTVHPLPGLPTTVQPLPGPLLTLGGAAVLVLLGAGLATVVMKEWIPWRRRQPRGRPGPPPGAVGSPESGAPVPPRAGQTPLR